MKGLIHTRVGSAILGLLCVLLGAVSGVYFFGLPAWADSVQQVVGMAGRSLDGTWRWTRSYRLDGNAGGLVATSTSDFGLGVNAIGYGCNDPTCTNLAVQGVLDRTVDVPIAASDRLFTSAAILYAHNTGGTLERLRSAQVPVAVGASAFGMLNVIPVGSQLRTFDQAPPGGGNTANNFLNTNTIRMRSQTTLAEAADDSVAPISADRWGTLRVKNPPTLQANNFQVSAANTINTLSYAAVAGTRLLIRNVDAYSSAGTCQLTITSPAGVTTLWQSRTDEVLSTARLRVEWPEPGLAGTVGDTIRVEVSACGAGNTSTLIVSQDRM